MRIKRDFYLQKLIDYRDDDRVKVITGIRRCDNVHDVDVDLGAAQLFMSMWA